MPLVKRSNGWYWGSQGPFDSKSKALQVARAAYAHGYKGESNEKMLNFLEEQKKSFSLAADAQKK
jgi:hypothetical protein